MVDFEYPSVGATENIMMAAVRADGTTVIRNAACEPEIVDLQGFLNACGFRVCGAGTPTVTIEGVEQGHGTAYTVMPDRIVTGTYLIGAAMTRGDVTVENTRPDTVDALLSKLRDCGCELTRYDTAVRVRAAERVRCVAFTETRPYPGFPTDLQPQLFAMLSVAQGTSVLVENVFENRFGHVADLRRMGARIQVNDRTAVVRGVPALRGMRMTARDLRGGAALVLAGLAAQGETIVENAGLIDRGYAHFEDTLSQLGARVERIQMKTEDAYDTAHIP